MLLIIALKVVMLPLKLLLIPVIIVLLIAILFILPNKIILPHSLFLPARINNIRVCINLLNSSNFDNNLEKVFDD